MKVNSHISLPELRVACSGLQKIGARGSLIRTVQLWPVVIPMMLAGGSPLARAVCGFIALFWTTRLVIQFFVFDAKPYLRNRLLRLGYHGLTVVFMYHAIVYSLAALVPGTSLFS